MIITIITNFFSDNVVVLLLTGLEFESSSTGELGDRDFTRAPGSCGGGDNSIVGGDAILGEVG